MTAPTLKELAMAVKRGEDAGLYEGTYEQKVAYTKLVDDFENSATPSTVLAMIAENERLREALKNAEKALSYCAIDPGYLHPANNSQNAVAANALPDIQAALT